ncbi:acetyl-CoA synthetase-like protein, partial [Colletotrichum sublineola]
LAWIQVTSGSTGRPKCSLHNHATLGSSIASYAGRTQALRSLLFFNPISSASGNAIWTVLTNGRSLYIPPQDKITSDLTSCINRYRINDICITPSAMSLISPSQVPSLQTASLIGEAASRTVTETWSPYVSLRIGYGATEMNSYCLPFHDEP